ncbi:LacI family DNA-binding transcriptional regulator [Nocardia sp. CWNU-33]|uniref:LacI family DNA-binding transcriptional regulator n=1 Tax=Nocardia sp. CWNU-33 TaxID=3392117 RepID=UPI00398E59DB
MTLQRRVTIHDVARVAGLSTSSVSRALTGARRVNPDVAARVKEAALLLGYRPDAVGRSLRRQETGTLGLVVPDITNPFFPSLVQAVVERSRGAGFGLLLVDSRNSADLEAESVRLLLDKRIDALLISASHRFLSKATIDMAAQTVPVIQLDRVVDEQKAYVRMDQRAAIELLVDHMVAQNRIHLAFLGSDPSVATSWERQEAFLQIAPDKDPAAAGRILVGDFTVEWGRDAAHKVRRLWPEVNGVICANDLIALGALQEFTAQGLSVPRDILISGFDDTLIAQASGLTSVRQPVDDMAEIAVPDLMAGVRGDDDPLHAVLEPELVIRDSSRLRTVTG